MRLALLLLLIGCASTEDLDLTAATAALRDPAREAVLEDPIHRTEIECDGRKLTLAVDFRDKPALEVTVHRDDKLAVMTSARLGNRDVALPTTTTSRLRLGADHGLQVSPKAHLEGLVQMTIDGANAKLLFDITVPDADILSSAREYRLASAELRAIDKVLEAHAVAIAAARKSSSPDAVAVANRVDALYLRRRELKDTLAPARAPAILLYCNESGADALHRIGAGR